MFVRYQSPDANARGVHPGVFALVNGLAAHGLLTEEQERFRRTTNDWYNATFTNPTDVDPLVYDRTRNPGAVAWFRVESVRLTERVEGYLEILGDHRVPCECIEADAPGRVIYEDADQVVVVPF
ncbi:MAG: hypothetical protein ABJB03_02645 [Rhodoglobus sp.]